MAALAGRFGLFALLLGGISNVCFLPPRPGLSRFDTEFVTDDSPSQARSPVVALSLLMRLLDSLSG